MKTTYASFSQHDSKIIESLVFLTDEPDEHLYINIADAIVSYGETILPSLRNKLNQNLTPYHRRRLESLVYVIERHEIIDKLKLWERKREQDLIEPCFILAKHRFPKVDWSKMGFKIMMLIEQAERELNTGLTPLEQVKTLNHIIYDVNKFRGEAVSIKNPDYYFINTLLDTHIGNPLSLGMLYCMVAERMKLPIYGIDLPNHFILAFCKQTESFPKLEDVLFYINPYNNGIVLTRKDIRNYLNDINIRPELKYFEPTGNVAIVKKLFDTLIEIYYIAGKDSDANEMREMMDLLKSP